MKIFYDNVWFQKVDFAENDAFPKYNLYAYSEGKLTENARKMQFNGAPVLFVPGNSGSYKQVNKFNNLIVFNNRDCFFF